MPDFARFLPLSNRPKADEDAVTSDRRRPLAAVVAEAARLLDAAESTDAASFVRAAGLSDLGAIDDSVNLYAAAATIATGRKRSTKALARAVRALLLLARELGAEPRIDPMTLGIVALYGATSASLERRAVIQGHALKATDADWEFGRGPVLEGTALEIAGFLLAVTDVAPQPAPRRPDDAAD
ncbi:hypothetical protein [Microbacterium sp. SS28]|uniref:hypothetical protein n=1 Tax=Microbacterium sp. SS28 TaxID=2919948 RepID=UPI001FAA23A1|nr:hypothetical protein [Microbacterium sp. SS28]